MVGLRTRALPLALLLALVPLAGCAKLRARNELNKGVRAYRNAQFDTAIEHFKRSVELDPKLVNARVYLAVAYATQFVPGSPTDQNKRMGKAALEAFEKVLEIDPNNPISLGYMATIYFGLGGAETSIDAMRPLLEKAKELRRRLTEVEPGNPEHFYSIAVIDWTLTYKPRTELKRKLALQADQPLPKRAREELVATNEVLVNEGIEMAKRAIEINPDYANAIAYLNLLYIEKADLVATTEERNQLLQEANRLADRAQKLLQQQSAEPSSGTR